MAAELPPPIVPIEPELVRPTEEIRKNQSEPLPVVPAVKHPQAKQLAVLDEGDLGGKVTICVLLYGDHHELHRRCLNSIACTVPPSRMELRIGCNQVCTQTEAYLKTLPVFKIYTDKGDRRKYPAMRAMFHDREHPIRTKWIVWFDDDSYVRQAHWLSQLADTIKHTPKQTRLGMLGTKMFHPFKMQRKPDPRTWFQQASWWRGVHFRNRQGAEAPNGDTIHFCVGGFWALKTAAMLACDIPDIRLNHNGGDITIGEQLHQGGYFAKQFNGSKNLVHTSAAPRRGFHEPFAWEVL